MTCTHTLKTHMPLAEAAVTPSLDCTTSRFSVYSIALRVYSVEIKMLGRSGFVKAKALQPATFLLLWGRLGDEEEGKEKPAGSAALAMGGITLFDF